MKTEHVVLVAAVAAAGGAGIGYYVAHPTRTEVAGAELRNVALSLNAPEGTITTEQNPAFKAAATPLSSAAPPPSASGDWSSYNKTLTSERFADLGQINTKNLDKLKVLCTYDTGRFTAFETGLLMVEGALIGTTEFDIFSLDPAT
jgi:alcohol dehydrogenase (cytochrome c)